MSQMSPTRLLGPTFIDQGLQHDEDQVERHLGVFGAQNEYRWLKYNIFMISIGPNDKMDRLNRVMPSPSNRLGQSLDNTFSTLIKEASGVICLPYRSDTSV